MFPKTLLWTNTPVAFNCFKHGNFVSFSVNSGEVVDFVCRLIFGDNYIVFTSGKLQVAFTFLIFIAGLGMIILSFLHFFVLLKRFVPGN